MKGYAEAQHAIEITEVAGSGTFELILTIILAAVTGGAGVVAAIGRKVPLIRKLPNVGDLLSDFTIAMRKLKIQSKQRKVKGKPADFKDLETSETTAKKGKSGPESDGSSQSKTKQTPTSGPGSEEHRAQRWKEYQERGGTWSKERWDKQYDVNMQQANKAHKAVADYRKANGLTDEAGWRTEGSISDGAV